MSESRAAVPRPYVLASLATLALTIVATTVGLFVPDFYRDAPALLPQVYGQDLLTLVVAVPAPAASLYLSVRGSLGGYVVWLGVTGYLLYVTARRESWSRTVTRREEPWKKARDPLFGVTCRDSETVDPVRLPPRFGRF